MLSPQCQSNFEILQRKPFPDEIVSLANSLRRDSQLLNAEQISKIESKLIPFWKETELLLDLLEIIGLVPAKPEIDFQGFPKRVNLKGTEITLLLLPPHQESLNFVCLLYTSPSPRD